MFKNPVVHPIPKGPDRFSHIRDMLTECNFLINLVHDDEQLLKGICHLIVDAGGFSRAWVRLASAPAARETTGTPGQDGAQAVQKDYYFASSNPARRSSMVGSPSEPFLSLPLKNEQATLGVLTVYCSESEPFDAQESGLIAQLAANLATRLVHLQEQRRLAAGPLQPPGQQPAHPAWRGNPGHEQAAQLGRQPLMNLLNG